MPIAGRGMLVNVMDVDPAGEADHGAGEPGARSRRPIVLIDGTDQDAVGRAGEELFGGQAPAGELVSRRTCRLMWDPSKAELNR